MRKGSYITLSILSLLNIVFVPTFDIWSGLFPSDYENTFFGAIRDLFTDSDAIYYWSVVIVLSVFLPCLLMIISAVLDNKVFYSVSSGLGIILWFRTAVSYIKQYGIADFFDFDDGSLSIGFWIALILFVIAFTIGITSKKTVKNKVPIPQLHPVETNYSMNQVVIEHGSFCPNCGNKIDKYTVFCGNCGYKF